MSGPKCSNPDASATVSSEATASDSAAASCAIAPCGKAAKDMATITKRARKLSFLRANAPKFIVSMLSIFHLGHTCPQTPEGAANARAYTHACPMPQAQLGTFFHAAYPDLCPFAVRDAQKRK